MYRGEKTCSFHFFGFNYETTVNSSAFCSFSPTSSFPSHHFQLWTKDISSPFPDSCLRCTGYRPCPVTVQATLGQVFFPFVTNWHTSHLQLIKKTFILHDLFLIEE